MIKKSEIKEFLEKSYDELINGSCATYFLKLDARLYLVVGLMDDDPEDEQFRVVAKIAYNCDDLQCDYGIDWYMPSDAEGNIDDTELELLEESLDNSTDWFYTNFRRMHRDIKNGELFCE